MNQNSLNWGIGITVIWLAVITSFWIFGGLSSPTSLNELGDFLAGIFAPIAFLWLILGYVQQGKQLEQNTKALEQQERALQLQIDEMRQGIEQQKIVTNIQKEQLFESQKSREARFFILQSKVRTVFDNSEITNNCLVALRLTIANLGNDAFNVKVKQLNNSFIIHKINKFLANEDQEIRLELDDAQVDMLNMKREVVVDFTIEYETKAGKLYKKIINTHVFQINPPFYGINVYLSEASED